MRVADGSWDMMRSIDSVLEEGNKLSARAAFDRLLPEDPDMAEVMDRLDKQYRLRPSVHELSNAGVPPQQNGAAVCDHGCNLLCFMPRKTGDGFTKMVRAGTLKEGTPNWSAAVYQAAVCGIYDEVAISYTSTMPIIELIAHERKPLFLSLVAEERQRLKSN